MKKMMVALATGASLLALGIGTSTAQDEIRAVDPATPVELFACKFNEGMGYSEWDSTVAKFNDWADKRNVNDYSAWQMVPYYSGPEQDFDVLWLGGSPTGAALGRLQDQWLAEGGKIADEFNEVTTCDAHVNYATLQFKTPPEREDPSNIIVSFSDCNMNEGVTFNDLYPSLIAWADYREANGSTSGMWVLFPAYGGGGEEFDFKFVAAWGNLEEQGVDFDQYSKEGWKKGNELFADKVDCDSARVYLTKNLRMAEDDEE